MNSNGIAIKDALSGRVRFYLDTSISDTVRDVNGKPVGTATGNGDISLTKAGAALMSGRDVALDDRGKLVLMDLGSGDVAPQTAARANFVTTANDFVADLVAPVKLIDHDRGLYWIESPGDSIQTTPNGGAAGAAVQTADIGLRAYPGRPVVPCVP